MVTETPHREPYDGGVGNLDDARCAALERLQEELRRCRLCVDAGYPVASLPVVPALAGQCAYLFGLAPGLHEGEQGRPWRGRAGATLRRWLRMDEDAFYAAFYCASVTRCYPGRAAGGRGDRTATAAERALCRRWYEREREFLQPQLVVTVGALALRTALGVTSLSEAVGKSYLEDGAIVVPLPHPSGASGWLNDRRNRARLGKALTHVRRELGRAGEDGG